MKTLQQFLWFCISGGLAFLIDAGFTQFWVRIGLDPWTARGLAFPVAVTFTWWFNRRFTFKANAKSVGLGREYLTYVGTQLLGLSVNLGSYALLVWLSATVHAWPVIGVAVGSIAGLLVNFLGARHVAFRRED
ncbi:MAG: GtrA family protein [Lysobacteraceae bacterium]